MYITSSPPPFTSIFPNCRAYTLSFSKSGVFVHTSFVASMAKKTPSKRKSPAKRKSTAKRSRRSTRRPTPRVSPRLVNVAQHVADTLYPKLTSVPRSHPDGQNVDHLVVNILTTGTFTTPYILQDPTDRVDWAGATIANTVNTCYQDQNGATIMAFTPGNLQYSYFPNVSCTQASHNDGTHIINSLQKGEKSAIYDSIVTNADSYRVIAANLKIHYIGNDDDNSGEIVVQKFDPLEMSYTNDLSDVSVPTTVNEHCKSTQFIPAKEGCEVAFFRAHRDGFSTYKQVGGNAPSGTIDAMRSLEAIILRVQGCASGASVVQSWRWELVQTVELTPKPNTLLSRLAHPSPTYNPTLQAITDKVAKHCSDSGHDIQSGMRGHPRMTCFHSAMSLAPRVASSLGSSLPSSGR